MGWQVVFRSRDIYGPYEEKTVLEQGSTPINGPHQGALVDMANGEWWFIHFQDAGAFGRIVHMQPVRWENDWPLMGVDHDGNSIGEPVPGWRKPGVASQSAKAVPQTSDEFEAARLGCDGNGTQITKTHGLHLPPGPDGSGWFRARCPAVTSNRPPTF